MCSEIHVLLISLCSAMPLIFRRRVFGMGRREERARVEAMHKERVPCKFPHIGA